MKEAELQIVSYFSIETDLAKAFSGWPEFVEGEGYRVLLKSSGGEQVDIEYEEKEEMSYIKIYSNKGGKVFERAVGLSTYLLSQHSDNLVVNFKK